MNDLVLLETAANEYWQSLSHDEQLAYLIAHPNSRFLTMEISESWFDKLSPFKQQEYKEKHPRSKFLAHLRTLPSRIRRRFHRLSQNSQTAIQSWHEKTAGQKAAAAAKALYHAGSRVLHHAGEYGKHEYHMYKGTGAALNHFAHGRKWSELHPHHKKALRDALIHAGITAGSLALGDVTGGEGIHAIGHLASAFAVDHANHTALLGAGQVLYKSGKEAIKKAVAAEEKLPPHIEAEAKKILKQLMDAGIPTHEWITILHEIEQQVKAKNNKLN